MRRRRALARRRMAGGARARRGTWTRRRCNRAASSRSPPGGKPALLYDICSAGARAYLDLAEEVLARSAAGRPAEQPGRPPAKEER